MTAGNLGYSYTQMQALDYTSYYYETSNHAPVRYGITAGNWDNMGISHGCIQFNLGQGTLQPILRDLINLHPQDVADSFTVTADYNKFVDMILNHTTADQIAWAETITNYSLDGNGNIIKSTGHSLKAPWDGYFLTLGQKPSAIDRQLVATQTYWNQAAAWASDFGLWSRRGYSLCFDMSVQAGGMTSQCHQDIMDFVAAQKVYPNVTPELLELYVMRFFAVRRSNDVTSAAAKSSFLDRKLAIANGTGTVYGGPVDTVAYDLILEPNGLLAIPTGKIPHFFRGFRTRNH